MGREKRPHVLVSRLCWLSAGFACLANADVDDARFLQFLDIDVDHAARGVGWQVVEKSDGGENDGARRLSALGFVSSDDISFLDDDPLPGKIRGELKFSKLQTSDWVHVLYTVFMVERAEPSSNASWTVVGDPVMQIASDQTAEGAAGFAASYLWATCPLPTSNTTTTSTSTQESSSDASDDDNSTDAPTTAPTAIMTEATDKTNFVNSSVAAVPTRAPMVPRCGLDMHSATHLLVRAEGLGCNDSCAIARAASQGRSRRLPVVDGTNFTVERVVKLADSNGQPPLAVPRAATFVDEDPNPNIIGGIVKISVPQPEPATVLSYRVYFVGEKGIVSPLLVANNNQWIAEASATGYDVEANIPLGTVTPAVSRLRIFAYGIDGLASNGVDIFLYDSGTGSVSSEVPVVMVAIILSVLVGVCLLSICAWMAVQFVKSVAQEEELREEERQQTKSDAVQMAEQFCYLEAGEHVEYWSFHRQLFMPAVISSHDSKGYYSIRLEFGAASEMVDNVPGSRLRRVFKNGEPVQVCFPDEGDAWVPGYVNGEYKVGLYSVRFLEDSARPPISGVLGKYLRTAHYRGEEVLVPWKAEYRKAIVRSVQQPQGDFPAQILVCHFSEWADLDANDASKDHFFSSAAVVRIKYDHGPDVFDHYIERHINPPNPSVSPMDVDLQDERSV